MLFRTEYYNKFKTLIVVILLMFAVFFNFLITPTHAATVESEDKYSQICAEKFKDPKYMEWYRDFYNAQQYDRNNNQYNNPSQTSDLTQAGCPPSLDDISFIVLRIITLLITVFGLFAFFMLFSGAFNIFTAGANKDKVKKGRGAIQSAVMGVIIVLVSYSLIIFVATRLGLANTANSGDQFSIVEGGRLIFRFLFTY